MKGCSIGDVDETTGRHETKEDSKNCTAEAQNSTCFTPFQFCAQLKGDSINTCCETTKVDQKQDKQSLSYN